MNDARQQVIERLQGAATLNLAFIGVANGLFDAFARLGAATANAAANAAGMDAPYVTRWCDAAYAFELLDVQGDVFRLSPLGEGFRAEIPGSLLGFPVSAMLGAHMAERATGLMRTGERPGEDVLTERATILPLFGAMLEHTFAPFFAEQIVPAVPIFNEVDERGGRVIDLGCGNGWYLRALARRCPHLTGLGLDGFAENVRQATERAEADGVSDRVRFAEGDIHHFAPEGPLDVIAMNRALHHVWEHDETVLGKLAEHLAPGGAVVIWEPAWPAERERLRHPRTRGIAFQNLMEHVQGNHFLRPSEVEDAMRAGGLEPQTHLFAEGNEAVIVGRKS